MTTRTVALIETATNEKVGAFAIKNVLPTRQLKQIDPFLLIHHMGPLQLAAGEGMRIPPHPHAGFEVVTYLLDGAFFHRDSKGHDQVGEAGDINWMSAGSGIVHSEGPSDTIKQTGGTIQLLQVWINVPAVHKKETAGFTHYKANVFPVWQEEGSWVKTIIGEWNGKASPIVTKTEQFWYHIKLKKDNRMIIPVKTDHSAGIYLLNGKLKVLQETAGPGDLIAFHEDGDQLSVQALEDAELMVFGGHPIREKVVSYGPFVMNSFEEVQSAIADYEQGKMGSLDS